MRNLVAKLLLLGLGLAGVAWAAEESSPGARISPEAQAVVDRVRGAYAKVDGWTATLVREAHGVTGGREQVRVTREVERYQPNPDGPAYYLASSYLTETPSLVTGQNPGDQYLLVRLGDGTLQASLAAPETDVRPKLWAELESRLGLSRYVNYNGRELVGSEDCDVVQCFQITTRPPSPERPQGVSILTTTSFYVNPAGFIVQQRTVMNGGSVWNVVRVTYDVATRLDAADFTREAFERAAAPMLRPGEAMPVLVPALFKPGQRLPDQRFIAWADRQPFKVSDFQGKVVVVETWASWCHFCKEAFPTYEKMRQQLAAQDVVFVAVSFDAKPADYEKWMNAHAKEYGFLFGLVDAQDANAAIKNFKGAFPAFYVLDRDGKILSAYSGFGYKAGTEDPRLVKALRQAGIKLDGAPAEVSKATTGN